MLKVITIIKLQTNPNIENPDVSILSPELYYEDNRWKTKGKAYVNSNGKKHLPFVGNVNNLYNVGTHNGKCKYAFTSMETAVTNGIYLSHIIEPKLKKKYKIKKFSTIIEKIRIILIIILLIIIYIITK